jgi:hypothetical protein
VFGPYSTVESIAYIRKFVRAREFATFKFGFRRLRLARAYGRSIPVMIADLACRLPVTRLLTLFWFANIEKKTENHLCIHDRPSQNIASSRIWLASSLNADDQPCTSYASTQEKLSLEILFCMHERRIVSLVWLDEGSGGVCRLQPTSHLCC